MPKKEFKGNIKTYGKGSKRREIEIAINPLNFPTVFEQNKCRQEPLVAVRTEVFGGIIRVRVDVEHLDLVVLLIAVCDPLLL